MVKAIKFLLPLVTALSAGSAVITATSTYDSSKKATCNVTVVSSGGTVVNNDCSILPSDLDDGTYPTTATAYTSADGLAFKAYNTAKFSNKIQFKKQGGYIYNTTSMNLGSIKINDVAGTLTVYGGSTENPSTTTITGSNGTYDLSGYNYFKIINSSSAVATASSIAVSLGSSSQKTLSSITINTAPTKTSYSVGECFDPTGLKINANYSDSTTDIVSYSSNSNSFSFDPDTNTALAVSNTSVKVTYGGKSCYQTISVSQASTGNETSTVTINFDDGGNCTSTSGEFTNLSFTSAQGSANNPPAYNSTSHELRLYYKNGSGNIVTLTPASGYKIVEVVLTASGTNYTADVGYSVDGGNNISGTWNDTTMTISGVSASSSFAFTNTSSSTQLRLKSIAVTLEQDGTSGGNTSTTTYDLVTNGLSAGDKVIITAMTSQSDTTAYTLTNTYNEGTPWYLKSSSATVSNSKLSYNSSLIVWTVGGNSSSGFTFTCDNGTNYLRGYNSNNKVGAVYNDTTYGDKPNNWSMTYTTNKGYTMSVTDGSNVVYFEFSGTSYNTFKAQSSEPTDWYINFYRETTVGTNPALEYAQTFLAAFTCDSTGANAPTFTTSWASLKTTFNNLASPHQTTLRTATANASGTTIEQAMARYDYVVAKYEYEDFIGRLSGNSANRMNSFSGDSANNLLLVLGSISLLGGLTYLAYFLKKRKED